MSEKYDSKQKVVESKKNIRARNKDNVAINSHAMTMRESVMALIIVFKDGTFDKHVVTFRKDNFVDIIDEENLVVKFKNKIYKLSEVEQEKK